MCESTVYLMENGGKALIMEEAAKVAVEGSQVIVTSISGERKTLVGVELLYADLMRHEIILRPRKS